MQIAEYYLCFPAAQVEIVNPPVAPKPGIAGGEITTTFAFLIAKIFFEVLQLWILIEAHHLFVHSHGFNWAKIVPLLDFAANVTIFNPLIAAKCAMPGVSSKIAIIFFKTLTDLEVDAASGNSKVI